MMLDPVSSENEGVGSGIGRARAFSLVIRACWCWRGGVVSAARARGLPGGWPYLLRDVRAAIGNVFRLLLPIFLFHSGTERQRS